MSIVFGGGFERALTRITSAERAQQIVELVSEAFVVTMAAQITTTPIILHTSRRLSLVTLLTNFLILPVQSDAMIFGGVVVLLGLVVQPLAWAVGWINRVARRLSHFPACDTMTRFTGRFSANTAPLSALSSRPTFQERSYGKCWRSC